MPPYRNPRNTKLTLIEVAEKMFGESGIEATSLREIAARAGQANTNAVRYHFKSKEGLVEAIFDYRIQKMEGPRSEILVQAEKEGRLGDARMLLEALCLPYLDLRDSDGRHSYAAFMMRYNQTIINTENLRSKVQARWPVLTRLLELLERRLPDVPPELGRHRIFRCNLVFQGMLVNMDNDISIPREGQDFARLLDDTLNVMTLGFVAPYANGTSGFGYPSASYCKNNIVSE